MGRKSKATLEAEASQGVADQEAPSVGPSVVPAHDPRNDLIDGIADKAHQERLEYSAYHGVELEKDEPKEEEEEKEEIKAEEEEPAEESQEEQEEPQEEDEEETLVVDGVPTKYSKTKIYEAGKRSLQKELAADKRLEEATRLLNEAKQRSEQPPKQDVAQQPPSFDAAEVAKAIQFGTEQEAAQAIAKLQERNTVVTPQQIAQWVDERYQYQTAVDWFKSEYPEIVKDPYLLQIAANAEIQKRSQGDQRTFKEIYKDVGDEVMAWREKIAGPKNLTDKQAKKAAVQTIPTASARKPSTPETKPPTASEIVDEMRRQRGQA